MSFSVYGSPATRIANAESGSTGQATTTPTTSSIPEGKDHGIARQILNPGGDKYDEQRFGAPAASQPDASHLPEEREAALESRMGDVKEDRSVKRQVL
jgi:hypothetical protein